MGVADRVNNVHLPNEAHDYGVNKRAAVYPFLAKYLGLDLAKIQNPDGSFNEGGIVIESQQTLYPFNQEHPLPVNAVRSNDLVKWN